MCAKQFILAIVVFVVALVGCVARISPPRLEGTPGGPIIVIRPDEEPSGTPLTPPQRYQCTEKPCWYLGSFDGDHWKNLPDHIKGVVEDPPKLPHYLHHNAVVWKMEARLKSGGPPVNISNIKLTLAEGVLKIDVATLNTVPIWKYKNATLGDKGWPTPRTAVPSVLLGAFSAVTVTERPNQPPHEPITKDNLDQLRIYYNQ